MKKIPTVVSALVLCLSIMGVAVKANAQTAPCAADYDRCSAAFPSEFRNVRKPGVPANACTLGAVYDRGLCASNFEGAQTCAPTVVNGAAGQSIALSPGQSITVTCGAAPRRPNRRRVTDSLVAFCDESLGAVSSDDAPGSCACAPIQGYNAGAPVVVSERVVHNHLVSTLRVAPHAREVRFGCLYVPNGAPRPGDQIVLRILGAVIAAQEQLARQVRQNTSDIGGLRNDVGVIQGQVRELQQRPGATATSTFRLQFDGGIGGLVHWNAGSPVGGLGGGFLLRPAVILRWSDSFGLRIFGGWGMGSQTNTPYRRMTPTGPVEQSAPLHHGTFGLDALIGNGSVVGIVGVGGYVAGRTAPAVVPGDVSGLLAWRASGRFGARFGGNDDAPVNVHLDVVGDIGVSNVNASDGMRFSSPVALGLGGEVMLTVTTR